MVAIMTCLPQGSDAVFALLHRGETPKFLRVGVTITSGRGSTLGAIAKNCAVTHIDIPVPKQPKTGARVCSCFGPLSLCNENDAGPLTFRRKAGNRVFKAGCR